MEENTNSSGDLEGQMQDREKIIEELKARGIHPYANDFKVTHSIEQLPANNAEQIQALSEESGINDRNERFRVAGRLLQINEMGKAKFLFIRGDGGALLQLYLKIDFPEIFALSESLRLGDIVGVVGCLFRTKKGKRALKVEELRILTKAVRPLPGKALQGEDVQLKDVEQRYRRRYVDMIVHPEVTDVFRKRAKMIRAIRHFFDERGYVECETRMLMDSNGGANARPFWTHHNTLDMDLCLRIATELDLKRIVVGGIDRVYEIGRIFRNEGLSRFHNPEFTSIEFYQAYATYETLMLLTEQLLSYVCSQVNEGNLKIPYQEHGVIDFTPPYRTVTMRALVKEAYPESPIHPGSWPTEQELKSLPAYAAQVCKGKQPKTYGEALVLLFESGVESALVQPTFVTEFPLEVSPLSRKNDECPLFVDRFELFVAGKELANGFSELNDPKDQRERFLQQIQDRKDGNLEAMDYDEDYCQALEYGLPPTAGEGIGIDRLVMVLCNQPSIRDVIFFPQLRREESAQP